MSRTPLFTAVVTLAALAACAPPADPTDTAAPLPPELADLEGLEDDLPATIFDLEAAGLPPIRAEAPPEALTDVERARLAEAAEGDVRPDLFDRPAALPDLSPAAWGRDGTIAYDDAPVAPPYGTYTRYTDFPIRYCVVDYTPDVGMLASTLSVMSAAAIWNEASAAKLVYQGDCSGVQIVVDFDSPNEADYAPFDGIDGILAHATYPYTGGIMEFDEAETWTTAVRSTTAQPIDLVSVALHEFGHTLGLTHSSSWGAVMDATYGGSRRTLTADDIAGVQALYGAPNAACEAAWDSVGRAENYAWLAWDAAYDAWASAAPGDLYASYASTYASRAWSYASAADDVMASVVYEISPWDAWLAITYASQAAYWAEKAAVMSAYSEIYYGNAASFTSRGYDGYTMYLSDLAETQATTCFAGG